jgi:hypothetical protein
MAYFWPMRSFVYAGVILCLLAACADGDLDVEALDFDSVGINQCGTATTQTEIFFKTSDNQALILDLGSPRLPSVDNSQSFTIPGQVDLIYRIFDDDVSQSYFCDDIPPVSPRVTEEIEASGGTLTIESTTEEGSNTVTHVLSLQDITLINASGDRVTDLTISNFGTITTTQ